MSRLLEFKGAITQTEFDGLVPEDGVIYKIKETGQEFVGVVDRWMPMEEYHIYAKREMAKQKLTFSEI